MPYAVLHAMPYPQCMTLLVKPARSGGNVRWKTPSYSRLPSCAGAGALCHSVMPAENSQSRNLLSPPPRLYRRYQTRSMARVPTAPATSPRTAASSGVIPAPALRAFVIRPPDVLPHLTPSCLTLAHDPPPLVVTTSATTAPTTRRHGMNAVPVHGRASATTNAATVDQRSISTSNG